MRPRGSSIVETLAYCLLFGILLSGVYALFLSSVRSYFANLATCEVDRSATTALARLSRELAEASAGSIRADTSPPGIVFGSPRDGGGGVTFSGSGYLEWHRVICYYLDGSVLIRKEEALASPLSAAPSLTDYSTTYFSTLSATPLVVASNVTSASFTGTDSVTIALTVEKESGNRRSSASVTTLVLPRN